MGADPTPRLVGRGLAFAEGVNFDGQGTLYCVDVTGGGVWRMLPGGTLQEWVRTGGGPNGSRFGPGGDLFIADCQRRAILRINPASGEIAVYADQCAGQPFGGPNDLCFGPDGTLYFTDPGGSSLHQSIGAVYAVDPQGAVTRVAGGLAFPNGLAVSPDGQTLVVGETHTGRLHRYALDGSYAEGPLLATLSPVSPPPDEAGPDGMAYGADGNLYVAHYGGGVVQVVAPDGSLRPALPGGGPTPTNVAFWDEGLYVAEGTSGSIYCLAIGVREQRPFLRPW